MFAWFEGEADSANSGVTWVTCQWEARDYIIHTKLYRSVNIYLISHL